jgi:protein-ribulosamine 3-kinase
MVASTKADNTIDSYFAVRSINDIDMKICCVASLLFFAPSWAFRLPILSLKSTCLAMSSSAYMETMEAAASKALGRPVHLESANGGGYSGGGGASTSAVLDKDTGQKYFVKSAINKGNMLKAEYLGVKAMSETKTIQTPTPIAFGQHDNHAFVLFEYLDFCGGGSQFELGVQLAKMHRSISDNGLFGFEVDNTIGATPQPNLPWMDNWPDFWDGHRLGHMLKLTGDVGLSQSQVDELKTKTRQLLSHNPAPSLLHGDLWGGNKGFCKKDGNIVPVIFDPATYYGDREADVAMTYLFGGFGGDFYKGYESEWPLPEVSKSRLMRMIGYGSCN